MPRTTKGNLAAKKHKAVLARTKGHYGARSRLFKTAKQSLIKSLQYAYRDRKNRKRDFRRLWICLLYTSPSPRDYAASRMPSSA